MHTRLWMPWSTETALAQRRRRVYAIVRINFPGPMAPASPISEGREVEGASVSRRVLQPYRLPE